MFRQKPNSPNLSRVIFRSSARIALAVSLLPFFIQDVNAEQQVPKRIEYSMKTVKNSGFSYTCRGGLIRIIRGRVFVGGNGVDCVDNKGARTKNSDATGTSYILNSKIDAAKDKFKNKKPSPGEKISYYTLEATWKGGTLTLKGQFKSTINGDFTTAFSVTDKFIIKSDGSCEYTGSSSMNIGGKRETDKSRSIACQVSY